MKRSSKERPDLIVLSDDDSASKSPAKKVERRERRANEPPVVSLVDPRRVVRTKQNDSPSELSREVAQLRQQVDKLERDKQGAIRIAGEHQERVEFLENLIDTKGDSVKDGEKKKEVDELQEKVATLTQQLEAERSAANEERRRDRARIDELTRKLTEASSPPLPSLREVIDMQQKVAKLEKEFQDACRIAGEAQSRVDFLENLIENKTQLTAVAEYLADKKEMDELKKEVASLSVQLLSAQRYRAKDKERIDELTRRLTEADEQPRQERRELPLQQRLQPATLQPLPPSLHPSNILQWYPEGTPKSVPFSEASAQLHDIFYESTTAWKRELLTRIGYTVLTLRCETCVKTLHRSNVLYHFFSAKHTKEMRTRNASISLSAFEFWLHTMESIPKQPTALAVTRKVGGASNWL